MTRFPAVGGGLSTAYTYVQDGFPADAEEGESLYHVTENRAYVFDGAEWIEQTVTDHGELSGINAGSHHSRYTDAEAASAAPVDDVNGQTGSVSISSTSAVEDTAYLTLSGSGEYTVVDSDTVSYSGTVLAVHGFAEVTAIDSTNGSQPQVDVQIQSDNPFSGSLNLNMDPSRSVGATAEDQQTDGFIATRNGNCSVELYSEGTGNTFTVDVELTFITLE